MSVDKPISSLDHERRCQITELMAGLTHKQNVATVMVTHDRSQLERVDTVYEMSDGTLEAMVPTLTGTAI